MSSLYSLYEKYCEKNQFMVWNCSNGNKLVLSSDLKMYSELYELEISYKDKTVN